MEPLGNTPDGTEVGSQEQSADTRDGAGEPTTLLAAPFVQSLLVQLRALDGGTSRDGDTDTRVLSALILDRERRRQIPLVADPDERTVARIRAYYNALAARIEAGCGLMTVPLVHLSPEGFGRVVLTVGKLVVVDRTLRDAHRFGFGSLEALLADAEAVAARALQLIGEFRAAAEA